MLIAKSLNEQVNKRKKAEAELKKSQELWQFALEGAGDGVWEYDFETDDIFFSRQYKQMLGYNDDEFKNDIDEWLSRIHPDDMEIIKNTERGYLDNTITYHQQEYRIKHKNGSYLYILDRGKIINYTPEGNPKRIIGTHTDITAQKESENEYKRISVVASANENGVVLRMQKEKFSGAMKAFQQLPVIQKMKLPAERHWNYVRGH
ncbi:MAG: PAS domain-containing protein [Ferruginibacter sp.]